MRSSSEECLKGPEKTILWGLSVVQLLTFLTLLPPDRIEASDLTTDQDKILIGDQSLASNEGSTDTDSLDSSSIESIAKVRLKWRLTRSVRAWYLEEAYRCNLVKKFFEQCPPPRHMVPAGKIFYVFGHTYIKGRGEVIIISYNPQGRDKKVILAWDYFRYRQLLIGKNQTQDKSYARAPQTTSAWRQAEKRSGSAGLVTSGFHPTFDLRNI